MLFVHCPTLVCFLTTISDYVTFLFTKFIKTIQDLHLRSQLLSDSFFVFIAKFKTLRPSVSLAQMAKGNFLSPFVCHWEYCCSCIHVFWSQLGYIWKVKLESSFGKSANDRKNPRVKLFIVNCLDCFLSQIHLPNENAICSNIV